MAGNAQNCPRCAVEFCASSAKQVACSRACSTALRRTRLRPITSKQCRMCGTLFTPETHRRKASCCSSACTRAARNAYKRARNAGSRSVESAERVCPCAKVFTPATHHQRFCSAACRVKFYDSWDWRKGYRTRCEQLNRLVQAIESAARRFK